MHEPRAAEHPLAASCSYRRPPSSVAGQAPLLTPLTVSVMAVSIIIVVWSSFDLAEVSIYIIPCADAKFSARHHTRGQFDFVSDQEHTGGCGERDVFLLIF